jgi:hypothetical protein
MTFEDCDRTGLWLVVDGVVHNGWFKTSTGEAYASCQENLGFVARKKRRVDKEPRNLVLCPNCTSEIEMVADAKTVLAKV